MEKKKVRGYSLKVKKGHTYCYVWNEHDGETSRKQRKLGSKNYSRSHGWRSLGNWNHPETHQKLRNHLRFKYGYDEERLQEMYQEVEKDILIYQ